MNKLVYFLLPCLSLTAQAEVFKCPDKFGQPSYQSKPCEKDGQGRQLDIKVDPIKEAQGRAKREALDHDYDEGKRKELESSVSEKNPSINSNADLTPN
jgi:hypothetical protein